MNASVTTPHRLLGACPACGSAIPIQPAMSHPDVRCHICGRSLWYCRRTIGRIEVLDVLPGMRPEYEEVKELSDALPSGDRAACVVVNLSQVERVNSGFIAGLVGMNKRMRSAGGRLLLCGLHVVVREVLNCTQLYQLFEIVESEKEALNACRCEPPGQSTVRRGEPAPA